MPQKENAAMEFYDFSKKTGKAKPGIFRFLPAPFSIFPLRTLPPAIAGSQAAQKSLEVTDGSDPLGYRGLEIKR